MAREAPSARRRIVIQLTVMSGWLFLAVVKSYYRLSSIPVIVSGRVA
jgi:hypothetical protein